MNGNKKKHNCAKALFIIIALLIFVTPIVSASMISCDDGYAGFNPVHTSYSNFTEANKTYIFLSNDLKFNEDGIISFFNIYANQSGQVKFKVWKPVTHTYYNCTGTCTPCSSFGSSSSCFARSGCSWRTFPMPARCIGTCTACSSRTGQITCLGIQPSGCRWSSYSQTINEFQYETENYSIVAGGQTIIVNESYGVADGDILGFYSEDVGIGNGTSLALYAIMDQAGDYSDDFSISVLTRSEKIGVLACLNNINTRGFRVAFGISGGWDDLGETFRMHATESPTGEYFGNESERFILGLFPFETEVCFTPENYTEYDLTSDTTICFGNYTDVLLTTHTDNISLDCDGSYLYGLGSGTAIRIDSANNTLIENCNIHNYTNAIYSNGSTYAEMRHNNLSWNDYGISLDADTENSFIWNNYLSNNSVRNAVDDGTSNAWNSTKDCYSGFNIIGGLCRGGNYYGDYFGSDTNFDGIGNTLVPYEISTNGNDYLPLTNVTQAVSEEFDFAIALLFLGLAAIFLFIAFNLAEQHSVLKTLFIILPLFIMLIGINIMWQIAPSWVAGAEGENIMNLLSLASNALIYIIIFTISYFVLFIIWGLLEDMKNLYKKE